MRECRRGSFLGIVYGHQVATKCGGEDKPTSGIISVQHVMDVDWGKVRITGKLWALCTIRFDSIFHSRTSTNGHLCTKVFFWRTVHTLIPVLNLSATVTFFLSPKWPL